MDVIVVGYDAKKTIAEIALSLPKSSKIVLTAFSNSLSSDIATKERMAIDQAKAVKRALIAEGVLPTNFSINSVELLSGRLYEERALRRVDINPK